MPDLDLQATHDCDPNAVMAEYGSYNLAAPGGVALAAGDTSLNNSSLSLDPLPISGIKLMQGPQPLGASIKMTSTGITINFGGPVGGKIELSATGIKIAYGPEPAGSSIELSATGITMKCGLTNQVQVGVAGVDVQGIKLSLQALASMSVQAPTLTETAANVSRTGGMTTMM